MSELQLIAMSGALGASIVPMLFGYSIGFIRVKTKGRKLEEIFGRGVLMGIAISAFSVVMFQRATEDLDVLTARYTVFFGLSVFLVGLIVRFFRVKK